MKEKRRKRIPKMNKIQQILFFRKVVAENDAKCRKYMTFSHKPFIWFKS